MEQNNVTLEQIGNSIKKAHSLGDIKNAKYLVGKYRELEAELSTAKPKDPNEAGVENLFGETPSDSGVLELEGNRIEYNVVDGIITLKITDSDGNTTTISLPIGSFTF